MTSTEAPQEAVQLNINGRWWDPARNYAVDAARTDYIIVTFKEELGAEDKQDIQKLNVVIQEYLGQNTYLCFYEGKDLEIVRAKPYVQQADVYRSKFKIGADVKAANVVAADGVALPVAGLASTGLFESTDMCTVDILFHEGLDANDYIDELVKEAKVNKADVEYSSRKVRMTMTRSLLKQLATHDCIRVIEEIAPKVINNNFAREIMQADILVNDVPYHGEGEIITVSDTGFDTGSRENCHPAFKGKVLDARSIVRSPELCWDSVGHGTHVCGSVVGENMTSTVNSGSHVGGIAPKAKLVMQSMYWEAPGKPREHIRTPRDLTDDLFDPSYKQFGARIFSNSWGPSYIPQIGQTSYQGNEAGEVDEFVWRTKDAVVVFSAGNDNGRQAADGKAAISGGAAAKNAITVGATGSKRVVKDKLTTVEQVADMSSRGPTKEGRIKPDVVAPGIGILSTRSQYKPYLENSMWGQPEADPFFDVRNGTSMAAPLVAGCLAILREVLKKHHSMLNPSAALVKALLINGATPLPQTSVPQDAQGFGRVHLSNSVSMIISGPALHIQPSGATVPSIGYIEGPALEHGSEYRLKINISAGAGKIFKITLAYLDLPKAELQNNLNLCVKNLGSGLELHGNGFEGEQWDEKNNVEQVNMVLPVDGGDLEVLVRARRIMEPTGFALAWSTS